MTSATVSDFECHLKRYIEHCAAISPAHDFFHIKRVVGWARKFALDEAKVDKRILAAATWLHEIDDPRVPTDHGAPSSVRSADIAAHYLRKSGLMSPDEIAKVHHAIAAHGFMVGIGPETPEARILRDAHRIDALGAVGVARCFVVGGRFGANLYSENEPFPDTRPLDGRAYIVDHFYERLFQLEETFLTAAGKREAERRIAFMHAYLDQLESEIF